MPETYVGIDIGGTKIAVGLVTERGELLAQDRVPTPVEAGPNAILDAAQECATALVKTHGIDRIAGIGIGTGGQIDPRSGEVLSATGLLPGWGGVNIAAQAAALFPGAVRVRVDNDVNALAAGEGRFGAARGLETVIFLALGTGVGGAILIGGRLHHGAHGAGGEFGHLLLDIDENARIDGGGDRGTLEAYCSGGGLVQTWREIIGEWQAPITGEEIAAQAQRDAGGPAAQAVAKTGEYLGYGLVSLANILDPDLIVIGGGLAQLGDALLNPAREVLSRRAMHGPCQCKVVVTSLGKDASLIGAASLAMASN